MDSFGRAIAGVPLVIAQWTTRRALLAVGYVFTRFAAVVWLLLSYRQALHDFWHTLLTEPDKPVERKWVRVCSTVGLVLFLVLLSCIMYFGLLLEPTDALYVGLVVLGAVGGIVAFLELARNARVQKARFLKELYSEFFNDPGIRTAFQKIENGELGFSERGFADPQTEAQVDRLLSFADLVCRLYGQGSIGDSEMEVFEYEFQRIHSSTSVRAYRKHLKKIRGKMNAEQRPFSAFVDFCRDERRWPCASTDVPKWEYGVAGRNLRAFTAVVESQAGSHWASVVREELRTCGDWYQRVSSFSEVAPTAPGIDFYGRFVGRVLAAVSPRWQRSALDGLTPFMMWRYGTSALAEGIAVVGWASVVDLVERGGDVRDDQVEVIWCLGLLHLLDLSDEATELRPQALRALSATGWAMRQAHRAVISACTTQLAHHPYVDAASVVDKVLAMDPHRRRLWLNAAAIGVRYGPVDSYTALVQEAAKAVGPIMLTLAAQGLNTAEKEALVAFQAVHPECPEIEGQHAMVRFLDDPLDILNIGNEFESCLRLARSDKSVAAEGPLGWALNPTVRIIAVQDGRGRLLGRQTIGLCLGQASRVRLCQTYPVDDKHVCEALDRFRTDFLTASKLQLAYAGAVADPVCANYDQDWLAAPPNPS